MECPVNKEDTIVDGEEYSSNFHISSFYFYEHCFIVAIYYIIQYICVNIDYLVSHYGNSNILNKRYKTKHFEKLNVINNKNSQ